MKYSILFQNLPAPSEAAYRTILESNDLTEIAIWLTNYDEDHGLGVDHSRALDPKIGLFTHSLPGGFPFIEIKKRISL